MSDNELDNLISRAFLELDFERAENKRMLDMVTDRAFNKISFFLFNKNILNNFFLFFSALAFVYSFNNYLNIVKAQKIQNVNHQIFISTPKNAVKTVATSAMEEKIKQQIEIPAMSVKVSRSLAAKKKITSIKKKEAVLPVSTVTTSAKENVKPEIKAIRKEDMSSSQAAMTESNIATSSIQTREEYLVNPKTEWEPVYQRERIITKKKKAKKGRFRVRKRRDHWGGVFDVGGYHKR